MKRTPLLAGGVLSQMEVGRRGSAGESVGAEDARSKLPDCPADNCPAEDGGVTEWLMVADCKSAGLTPYVGSNPTPTMKAGQQGSGAAGQ
jgi:hypothetical protein